MEKTSFMFWYMILLVYLTYIHSLLVFGETMTITATPGQNVSLPCNYDSMPDGSVRWHVHSDYISTEKIIAHTTGSGLLSSYFAIPGEDADYSLFIKIPNDINIWSYLDGDYECRLTSSGEIVTTLNIVTLHIYQSLPKCTSLHINDTTSIASCSYNIPSDMESLIWKSNGRTLTTINCSSSNVCTLYYTYNLADIAPHGLTCNVNESGKSCSINEIPTDENSETSSIRNTPPTTMSPSTPITTKEIKSTTENPDQSTKVETSFTTTENTGKSTINKLSVNQTSIKTTTSTEFATTYEQINSTENPDFLIQPIAIISVAFVIILLLIIFIIYYVRRCSQYKQNPSFKSAPPDDNEYVEVDLKVNPTTKGENQEIMENSKESVMEENQIYESADMNGKQINDEQKKKIKNVIVDGEYTNRMFKTGEQVLKQSEALKKSASENSNEDRTNDGVVYHENEAYESLDDINVNNSKLDLKESDKNKNPAYVHYEVLERE